MVWTDLSSVLSQFTRLTERRTQTDGQTDRILIARPRLHSMQRGNKPFIHSKAQMAGLSPFQFDLDRFPTMRIRRNCPEKN